jgi:hypothetical protein
MALNDFEDLLGYELQNVTHTEDIDGDHVIFELKNGETYQLYHAQQCCEQVNLVEIIGDLSDLRGAVILADKKTECGDLETWTFYRISTGQGLVVFRWYGISNGYYSEEVDFERKV